MLRDNTRQWSLAELQALPTLATGQADDLKIEDEMELRSTGGRKLDTTMRVRVWLSRCTVADGEPYDNKVTVERLREPQGRWETLDEYEAS